MSFLGEVAVRVGLLGAIMAGVMGAVTGATENIRAVSCVVIMFGVALYTAIEFRSRR